MGFSREPRRRLVGHLEHLVEVDPQRGNLSLELVDAVAVAHVLGEVVKAVHPVVEGAGDQHDGERDHGDCPQRHAVDVEDRPADVDGGQVAVAEDGRRGADDQAHHE